MATIESTTVIRPFSVDFAAWQKPKLFTNEPRAAFTSLRDERRSP